MSSETPDSDPEVYKVIGAPGTGKTTRVVGNPELPDVTSLVMENLEEYPWDDQMIVTYTKAGTEEAAERLSKILDEPKYLIDENVRTIHSACYHTLGVDHDNVVSHWDKKKFCGIYDLEYGWDDDEDDIMGADKAAGNALFDLYGWLQSNLKDLSEWKDCPADWTGEDDPAWLMQRWEEYKEENDLVGFGDMIVQVVEMARRQVEEHGWGVLFADESTTHMEMFKAARTDPNRDPEVLRGNGAFLDTKVLYVDEVQDLSPLQWAWYLAQKLVCEKVYIGGDDDQTIYGWAGANPDFMLGEEGDFEVLDKTYRIPEEVWETCDGVIQQVDNRQEKEVAPHGDGGEVVKMRRPSPRQLVQHAQDGSVFILFRARYMIDEFTDHLHEHGIPYDNMSTFETWEDDVVAVRDGLAKIKNDEDRLSGDELQALMDVASDDMMDHENSFSPTERAFGNFSGVEVDRAKEMFDLSDRYSNNKFSYQKFIDKVPKDELNYYQKEAVKGNLKKGNEDMNPERVRIGTIHSSKGKEAETVILCLDSTKTILENMRADTMDQPGKNISDAERRVYYVGMTRASERLVLAEGAVSPDTTLLLEDLLGDDNVEGDGDGEADWNSRATQSSVRRF